MECAKWKDLIPLVNKLFSTNILAGVFRLFRYVFPICVTVGVTRCHGHNLGLHAAGNLSQVVLGRCSLHL